MNDDTWLKQSDTPLFPELEWNKPERRDQAGRLLLIGGNTHALSAPAMAYAQARASGIGDVKVVLPDKTRALIDRKTVDAVFLKSTPSGELAQNNINELLEYALWANTILLTGDVGRNSQTSILLEDILRSFSDRAVITKDAIESLASATKVLFERERTTLVVSFSQLQKLLQNYKYQSPLHFTMGIVQLVEFLQDLTANTRPTIITLHNNQFIVADNGRVVTTKIVDENQPRTWRLNLATKVACYQTWNPDSPLQSAAQAVFDTVH